METLGVKNFSSQAEAIAYARITPLEKIVAECGVIGDCYVYVNSQNQIECALIFSPANSYPADEIFFVGNYTARNPAAVELGRKGGSVKSAAKSSSSAANGKLGGRPKKAKNE